MTPLGALLTAALVATAAPAIALDERLYGELLERHTQVVRDTAGTRVDYIGLGRSPEWKRVVASLAATSAPSAPPAAKAAKAAFWINAYNILAIQVVLDAYPVDSIRDVGSFFRPVWKMPAGKVGGRTVTLHEIEHEILRPMGDPRIHAAIICASVSCPPLRREPWNAQRLEAQYDDSIRRWLAIPQKGVRIDRAAKVVHLSNIFSWFEEDFATSGGVLAFIGRYLDPTDRAWLAQYGRDVTLRYLDYDWSLNALPKQRP